jgi:succinate dehydrogenase / fumarate reductase, cytochrome b subunit
MIKNLFLYHGHSRQHFYILHRLSGMGLLLFLVLHVLSTATVYFAPSLYEKVIVFYQSLPFGIVEIILLFCVCFHGVNGLRLVFFELFARQWSLITQRNWNRIVWLVTFLLWIPGTVMVLRHLLSFKFGFFH